MEHGKVSWGTKDDLWASWPSKGWAVFSLRVAF